MDKGNSGRHRLSPMILAALSLSFALQPPAAHGARPVARFQLGADTMTVTADEVALEMAFHERRKDGGRAAAEHLANTTIVTMEAGEKKLAATDAEARAFWEAQKAEMRRRGEKPENTSAVRNSTEAELLQFFALHLTQEKLVRQELGMKAQETVSADMLKLWLQEARKRHKVVTDPDQLPIGTAARVDDRELSMLDLGKLLLRTSDDAEQETVVQRVVVLKSLDQLARKHDVQVSDADLRGELALRAADAASDPRLGGVPFEQILKSQGLTPELLLRSAVFRAHVLQKKLAAKLHPQEQLEATLAKDRQAVLEQHGARRQLRGIFVRAVEQPNELVPRDFKQALAHLAEVRKQLLSGRDFELLAKIETEHPATKSGGGDLGFHHRRTEVLPDALLAAAFALPVGGLSEPVQVPEGCWLVKVVAVEPEPSDAQVIQRMRERLVRGMTQQIVRDARIEFVH